MRHELMVAVALGLMAETATAIVFDVSLDPGQEVPAPTLIGHSPSGSATVDVNTITGAVNVTGSYTGMTSIVKAAHLHGLAPPGMIADPIVTFTVSGGMSGGTRFGGK